MQRILDPAQIEAFTERSIPRVRLCDPASVFAVRGRRLRGLAEKHALGDYLRLMAAVADAQQVALGELLAGASSQSRARDAVGPMAADGAGDIAPGSNRSDVREVEVAGPSAPGEDRDVAGASAAGEARGFTRVSDRGGALVSAPGEDRAVVASASASRGAHGAATTDGARDVAGAPPSRAARFALAHAHGMPLLPAAGGPRERGWRSVLNEICASVAGTPGFPPGVRAACERILALDDAAADGQADLLLAERASGVDAQAAPFIMAALQVYWAASAASLHPNDVTQIDVPGVCPVCGTLPVSSIVRSDKRSQGYRYLHCALCATEWHMVRIVCSHCQANEGIAYHTIEGGSDAIRAESCGKCHTYRKILYQEKDPEVEPVADDLASVALDLLMSEEGFHRGSGNPLLWQNADA
jgi:FdhE protein